MDQALSSTRRAAGWARRRSSRAKARLRDGALARLADDVGETAEAQRARRGPAGLEAALDEQQARRRAGPSSCGSRARARGGGAFVAHCGD